MDNSLVLIVDDNTENIKILGSLLEQNGFNIAIAVNGPMALDFVEKKTVDIILLDIMMPQMDGYEVCSILKRQPHTKDIPVIFITALDDVDNKVKAFAFGAVDYITKPFLKEEVMARVKVHLKLKQTLKLLEEQAIIDSLTKAYNRNYLEKMVAYHIAYSKRENTPFSVCYFDLDGFKEINDNLGHAEGDKVLCYFVNSLRNVIRETDLIFRLGGDEFLVIFPGFLPENSLPLIDRLREKLDASPAVGDIAVSFSFGFALFDPASSSAGNLDNLLAEADNNMYNNKKVKKSRRR